MAFRRSGVRIPSGPPNFPYRNGPTSSVSQNTSDRQNEGTGLRILWTALRLWVLFPAGLALFMWLVTPTYFRPMYTSLVGFVLLGVLATMTVGGYAFIEFAVWLARRGHVVVGVLVGVAYGVMGPFRAMWLVLLGPAALILMSRST